MVKKEYFDRLTRKFFFHFKHLVFTLAFAKVKQDSSYLNCATKDGYNTFNPCKKIQFKSRQQTGSKKTTLTSQKSETLPM